MMINRVLLITIAFILCSIFVFNLTATQSYALPKPYQDKINESKKKRQEEKEKKKKEEEEKKKEEEEEEEKDEDKVSDDNNQKLEPGVRYLVPLDPEALIFSPPNIKIIECSLFNSAGTPNIYFVEKDTIGLRLKYRVTDYMGWDNVNISVNAYNDSRRLINSDFRTNPLRIGSTEQEEFHNLVNPEQVGSDGFRVEVEIEVENKRERSSVNGWISKGFGGDSVRIIDAYLASDNDYFFDSWSYPAREFKAGDPYRLVVEYETNRGIDDDVEFEYIITTTFNHVIDSGKFWDRARDGVQRVSRRGWFSWYLPENHSRIRLEVTAHYNGDYDLATGYYDIYFSNYNEWYGSGYSSKPILNLGPVYFVSDSQPSKYRSYFRTDENVSIIFNYEYGRGPYDTVRLGILDYIVYDQNGARIFDGKTQFYPVYKDKKKFRLFDAHRLGQGRYEVELNFKVGDNSSTHKSYFYLDDSQPNIVPDNENPTESNPEFLIDDDAVEYQLDEYCVIKAPTDWHAKVGYEDGEPLLTFNPDNEISGEVLIFKFDNPEMRSEDAVGWYEQNEAKISSIGEYFDELKLSVNDKEMIYRFYDGSKTSKGEFFGEKSEEIKLAIIYHFLSNDDGCKFYVIRIVAPPERYDDLYLTAMFMSKMIRFL